MRTWGEDVSVLWSHQAVWVNHAKSNSWPTHCSHKERHSAFFLCPIAAREEGCFSADFSRTGIHQLQLFVLTPTHIVPVSVHSKGMGTLLKVHAVHILYLLSPFNMCIPVGRVVFELKNMNYVEVHKHIFCFTLCRTPPAVSVSNRQSSAGKYQDRVCHEWLGVSYQPVQW